MLRWISSHVNHNTTVTTFTCKWCIIDRSPICSSMMSMRQWQGMRGKKRNVINTFGFSLCELHARTWEFCCRTHRKYGRENWNVKLHTKMRSVRSSWTWDYSNSMMWLCWSRSISHNFHMPMTYNLIFFFPTAKPIKMLVYKILDEEFTLCFLVGRMKSKQGNGFVQ